MGCDSHENYDHGLISMEPMFGMCVDHNENIAAIDAGIICISWRRGRITAFGKNPVFRIIDSDPCA